MKTKTIQIEWESSWARARLPLKHLRQNRETKFFRKKQVWTKEVRGMWCPEELPNPLSENANRCLSWTRLKPKRQKLLTVDQQLRLLRLQQTWPNLSAKLHQLSPLKQSTNLLQMQRVEVAQNRPLSSKKQCSIRQIRSDLNSIWTRKWR